MSEDRDINPQDIHIDFHAPEQGIMKFKVYGYDRVRVDVGQGLSMFLTEAALDCLARQLELAKTEMSCEEKYSDPLLGVWNSAVESVSSIRRPYVHDNGVVNAPKVQHS